MWGDERHKEDGRTGAEYAAHHFFSIKILICCYDSAVAMRDPAWPWEVLAHSHGSLASPWSEGRSLAVSAA